MSGLGCHGGLLALTCGKGGLGWGLGDRFCELAGVAVKACQVTLMG